MKFTFEVEHNSRLSFLDVQVVEHDHGFETRLFRKATFSGSSTKYDSAISNRFKYNLIQCLITRAFRNCSGVDIFNIELKFLRNCFLQNKFPLLLLNSVVRTTTNGLRVPIDVASTVEKKLCFVLSLS